MTATSGEKRLRLVDDTRKERRKDERENDVKNVHGLGEGGGQEDENGDDDEEDVQVQ